MYPSVDQFQPHPEPEPESDRDILRKTIRIKNEEKIMQIGSTVAAAYEILTKTLGILTALRDRVEVTLKNLDEIQHHVTTYLLNTYKYTWLKCTDELSTSNWEQLLRPLKFSYNDITRIREMINNLKECYQDIQKKHENTLLLNLSLPKCHNKSIQLRLLRLIMDPIDIRRPIANYYLKLKEFCYYANYHLVDCQDLYNRFDVQIDEAKSLVGYFKNLIPELILFNIDSEDDHASIEKRMDMKTAKQKSEVCTALKNFADQVYSVVSERSRLH